MFKKQNIREVEEFKIPEENQFQDENEEDVTIEKEDNKIIYESVETEKKFNSDFSENIENDCHSETDDDELDQPSESMREQLTFSPLPQKEKKPEIISDEKLKESKESIIFNSMKKNPFMISSIENFPRDFDGLVKSEKKHLSLKEDLKKRLMVAESAPCLHKKILDFKKQISVMEIKPFKFEGDIDESDECKMQKFESRVEEGKGEKAKKKFQVMFLVMKLVTFGDYLRKKKD